MIERLTLRQRFALFFVALFLSGLVAIVGGLWVGYSRSGGTADGYIIAGVIAACALLGATAWVGFLFDENVAKPILALSADLSTRARTDVEIGINEEPARHLGALAPSANAINAALIALRGQQQEAVERETNRIARDNAMFEALLRNLAEGVVVITPDQRVMLYNRFAQDLIGNLGIDRPLAAGLKAEPMLHALERLAVRTRKDKVAVETFLASTSDGKKFLLGQVSSIMSGDKHFGHVLIFNDATEDLAARRASDHLFTSLLEGARRSVAAIGATLDVLQTDAEMPPDMRVTFNASMQEEVDRLMLRLKETGDRYDRLAHQNGPMSAVSTNDIFLGLQTRKLAKLSAQAGELFVICDAFAILELLTGIIRNLAEGGDRSEFTFGAEPHDSEVRITLSWIGKAVGDGQLEDWLRSPLSPAYGKYSGRNALAIHRTEVWSEATPPGHRIVLPLAAASAPSLHPTDERPEFYDFDLPALNVGSELDDRPLSDLRYVVFDTETTGLSPRSGDEIVQIAGVRIVNGRILRGEVFDTLVDPQRAIPPASTDVHGIDDTMVKDAPDIVRAGQAFHDFCQGSILVAHNAPFDLAFLRLKQEQINRNFDHPVLCTVLLSAAMFDHSDQHTLDALAARFGVTIPEKLRHTALGDAMATAEVFLQMLDVMKGAGITTLGQARTAARRMTQIRKAQQY